MLSDFRKSNVACALSAARMASDNVVMLVLVSTAFLISYLSPVMNLFILKLSGIYSSSSKSRDLNLLTY